MDSTDEHHQLARLALMRQASRRLAARADWRLAKMSAPAQAILLRDPRCLEREPELAARLGIGAMRP